MIPSGSLSPGIDPAAFGLPEGTALRYERPAAALGSLVASYAVLDSDTRIWNGPSSWLLPGWAQIWIGLAPRGTVTVRIRSRRPKPLGAAVLYGPTSRAMPITSHGGVTVAIDLAPAGWARWFDKSADLFRDQILPLDRLWGAERTGDLIAALHGSDRGVEVKPVLDEFLLSALPAPHRDEDLVARIAALIGARDTPTAADVAAALDISSSTLLRQTNRHFGYPIKLLIRRTRFLRILAEMMTADTPPDHGEVPPGYHDVPHFLRDAKEFLGVTPRRFLAMPMPYLRAAMRARALVIGAPLPLLD